MLKFLRLVTPFMPKYSTGGTSSSSDGDACELCGTESSSLTEATIAGAQLSVCPDCSPHDDSKNTESQTGDADTTETDRRRDAIQKATDETASLWDGDSSHWEQHGTDYDSDQLPYLKQGYGETVKNARQEAGLEVDELARDLGVDELSILAVERGQAAQNNVGGSLIEELEDALHIELTE